MLTNFTAYNLYNDILVKSTNQLYSDMCMTLLVYSTESMECYEYYNMYSLSLSLSLSPYYTYTYIYIYIYMYVLVCV